MLNKLGIRLVKIQVQHQLKVEINRWARHIAMEMLKKELGAPSQTFGESISAMLIDRQLHCVLTSQPFIFFH